MGTYVSDSRLFRDQFSTPRMREIFSDENCVQKWLDVEAALAKVQARLGVIPAEAAAQIVATCKVELLDLDAMKLEMDRTSHPIVPLLREMKKACPGEAMEWVHYGATTQDIMDTAVVLQVRQALALIRADLMGLNTALGRLAYAQRHTVMAGRTHLQQALPVTFGYKVAVWLSPLITMQERLEQLRPRVEKLQFGGAAGTLASLGGGGIQVQQELGRELGLTVPDIPWHVARDGLAEAVCFLGLLAGSLSKLATDVMLMMQTEVAEVAEPHQDGRGGSSTMPQKRNPISCEYILAQSRGVHALVPQMLSAMAQDQERGTGPWQAEPLAIGQAFLLTHGALTQARVIAEGLTVDAARMRQNLESTGGLIVAEQVMMGLAPSLGRGEAHHVVHHACDLALAQRVPLASALLQDPQVAARLTPQQVATLCDPSNYLGSTQAFIDNVLQRLG